MLRVILLHIAVVASTCATSEEAMRLQWEAFKKAYNKTYQSLAEEERRFKVFQDNSVMIDTNNEKYSKGLVFYELGINEFSDMSKEEVLEKMTCYRDEYSNHPNTSFFRPPLGRDYSDLPEFVDWRQKGAVTPVKIQGKCNSCWAFSATGAIEGHHFLKYGQLVSLSEQNLVDCTTRYGNKGCIGGFTNNAFAYVRDSGIDTEDSYPYEGRDGPCRFRPQNVGATIKNFLLVPEGSEALLKMAVATAGPVSVAIDATLYSFVHYTNGVYHDYHCRNNNYNHAVLVVGYGVTSNGVKYWIVKNSWGSEWGQGGYVYMARELNNLCGIASRASFPVV